MMTTQYIRNEYMSSGAYVGFVIVVFSVRAKTLSRDDVGNE